MMLVLTAGVPAMGRRTMPAAKPCVKMADRQTNI
jgi:hypothetical protein